MKMSCKDKNSGKGALFFAQKNFCHKNNYIPSKNHASSRENAF